MILMEIMDFSLEVVMDDFYGFLVECVFGFKYQDILFFVYNECDLDFDLWSDFFWYLIEKV